MLGLALLATFVWWENRCTEPMLPLELFKKRNFAFANVETFAVYAGLSTLTCPLPRTVSAANRWILGASCGCHPRPHLVRHVPALAASRPALDAPGAARASSWVLGRSSQPSGSSHSVRLAPGFTYWWELLLPLLVFAVGLSMTVAPLTATVLSDVKTTDAGKASGVNNAVARVAGLLGIAVVGAAIAGSDNTLDLAGYRLSMAITAGLVAAGGVIGLIGIRNTT